MKLFLVTFTFTEHEYKAQLEVYAPSTEVAIRLVKVIMNEKCIITKVEE